MTRDYAIFAFTAGFVGMWLLFTAVAYFLLRPFGVGYIGAELMCGYLGYSTAYRWETVTASLDAMLEESGL